LNTFTLVIDFYFICNTIVPNVCAEAVYGNGTYFAVEARKAMRYSNPDVNGHRHMYWCRVLTGEYTRGRTDLIVAPVKTAGTYDLYDSVVDIVESPTSVCYI
jgi:hypothetical protein